MDTRKDLHEKAANPILNAEDIKELSELTPAEEGDMWIWEGYLAKGHITLFSALWKSGKSSLIAYLLKAIIQKESFLEQKTAKVNTLVITEENEAAWVERRELESIDTDGTEIFIWSRPIRSKLNAAKWEQMLDEVATYCQEKEIDLVIFDTISKFWPVEEENNSSQIDAAWLPFNRLTDNGLALLLVHHFRKSGGDNYTASRGSGAISANADIIIDFSRLEGAPTMRRILTATSRYRSTPPEIVAELDLDEGTYTRLGTRAAINKDENKQRILEMVPIFPESITRASIQGDWRFDAPVPQKRTINRYLYELIEEKSIVLLGNKQSGATPRYTRRDRVKEPLMDIARSAL